METLNNNVVTTSIEQKSDIANTFVKSMKGNDWHLMRSLMHEDINWTLPGDSLLSGLVNGVDAVIHRARSLKAFGVTFNLLHVHYGLYGVAISLHNTAKRNELILNEYVVIVFELRDGKIAKMTTYLSDVKGINKFFVDGVVDSKIL